MALDLLNLKNEAVLNQAIEPIVKIAQNDPHKLPKAKAIELLGKLKSKKYQNLLFQSLNDSSYTVCGEALNAYEQLDPEGAYNMAVKLSREKIKGRLLEVVAQQIILNGDENNFKTACSLYKKMPLGQEKLNITFAFATLIGNTSQTEDVKEGIDAMLEFRNAIPERYGLNPVFDNFFKLIIGKKETIKKTNPNTGEWDLQINYIKQKLN
jgi:aminopeptidase N